MTCFLYAQAIDNYTCNDFCKSPEKIIKKEKDFFCSPFCQLWGREGILRKNIFKEDKIPRLIS